MKRLLRTVLLVGVVAAIVTFLRSRRDTDPLPQVASPDGEAWPRLPAEPAPTATLVGQADDVAEPESEDESGADAEVTDEASDADEADATDADQHWVLPTADGDCPDGYPLKANVDSGIYHAPGQMSYDRTIPERCYAEGAHAEADGFRAAKR